MRTKVYMTLQRKHQRPIAEGFSARMPASAHDYIRSNLLLKSLYYKSIPRDTYENDWRGAIAELLTDGYRYIVIHARYPKRPSGYVTNDGWAQKNFRLPPPIYEDNDVQVIDIAMWDGPFLADGTAGFREMPLADSLGVNIGDKFTLHSWSVLDSVEARPCQDVTVESWWSIDQTDAVPHDLMLILADSDGDGQLAITEKVPADRFTTEWRTGVYYRDQTAITIPCATADGNYPLLLGMKESMSGASLPIQPADGSAAGSLLYLTTLKVGGD